MSKSKKCSCGCSPAQGRLREYRIGTQQKTLADLVARTAEVRRRRIDSWDGAADGGACPVRRPAPHPVAGDQHGTSSR